MRLFAHSSVEGELLWERLHQTFPVEHYSGCQNNCHSYRFWHFGRLFYRCHSENACGVDYLGQNDVASLRDRDLDHGRASGVMLFVYERVGYHCGRDHFGCVEMGTESALCCYDGVGRARANDSPSGGTGRANEYRSVHDNDNHCLLRRRIRMHFCVSRISPSDAELGESIAPQ